MLADGTDIAAVLDGWRAQGADRMDPLRFHRIAALHRRAGGRDGEARRALDARLGALVEAYARDVARARRDPSRGAGLDPPRGADGGSKAALPGAPDAAGSADPRRGALGALVDGMTARARVAATNAEAPSPYPELPALEDFRALWSTLRIRSQVRESLAPAPTGAGPLNSGALAHRSLALMRTLSPDYLQHFLAYVDTLSWLETMHDAGVLAGGETPQAAGTRPRSKPRARKRSRPAP
ncbi:DUF2894 domain-containing protein [Luteimonas sp. BDR2-5]|uniref:DUF2894 domain-containing protein n=1 Tax=Proluteimonas luteida TaxID=2878685 RepID=UPI001E2B93B6|nr:DUF2894 domain-containing protein [Luteimonas sp. BDR2-5]MCD9029495.1 DUF2894 domain-containing protein [Luteimonas sp. BDR2-5]